MSAIEESTGLPESEKQDYERLMDHFSQAVERPTKPETLDERIESIEARLARLESLPALPGLEQTPVNLTADTPPDSVPVTETSETGVRALAEEVTAMQRRLEALQHDATDRAQKMHAAQEQIERNLTQLRREAVEYRSSDRERALTGFWDGLTTQQKLECIALSLPEPSELTRSLRAARETAALLEPADMLLKWAVKYPSACAEKLGTLFAPLRDNGREIERLTVMTLIEVCAAVETTLLNIGVAYVSPAPGTPASAQWETAGEEASVHPRGTVVRVLRGGLTHQGKSLIVPAVIVSSSERRFETPTAPPPPVTLPMEPAAPSPPAEKPEPFAVVPHEIPSWLTTLQAASLRNRNPEESRLLEVFEALASAADGEAFLTPLEAVLPLLSPCRHYYAVPVSDAWRATWEKILPEFTEWLKAERSIVPLSPSSNEGIDESLMEVTDTRQTLHEAEGDHVSRLERPGAMQGSRVLFRAQVQAYRYERG